MEEIEKLKKKIIELKEKEN